MSDITIVVLIIIGAVILFVTNRVPVVLVAMAVPLALYLTGVLSLIEVFAGFGDPTIIFIATLFIVSTGLESAGVTAWAGQLLIRLAGTESRARLILFTVLMVSVLTAAISVNGAVAALLPVVVVMAIRTGTAPSQLLMPLAFGAHCGSMLALSGTPVSVLINDALVDAGGERFGFFEFAWVGVPMVVLGTGIMVLFGEKLLPKTQGPSLPGDFSRHARTLVEEYGLVGKIAHLRVRAGSPLAGRTGSMIDIPADLTVRRVEADGTISPLDGRALQAGDVLAVGGPSDAIAAFAGTHELAIREPVDSDDVADGLFNRASGLAEVMIPPRSPFIGRPAFPGQSTDSGDLLLLAVQRGGETLPARPTPLRAGDTLLMQGSWAALDERLANPGIRVVDSPEAVRMQAVPLGPGAKVAILTLIAMVALLAFNLVQPAIAGLIAAFAMMLTRVVSVEQAYRGINWTTIILVGAMMPLSTAMFQTGAAQLMADYLVRALGDAGPTTLLIALFIICAILGQVISNMATALIVIPVAVLAANGLGVNPTPVLMAVNVACAASFLTPIATPVNLMVMGPAGYQFTDYWKLGGLMMLMFFLISVFYVPLIWPF